MANFVALATGAQSDKHYKGTPIHRVVPGAFVQGGGTHPCGTSGVRRISSPLTADWNGDGGDLDLTGKGDQSVSSDGGLLPDETFAIKHTRAGIIVRVFAFRSE